MSSRDVRRSVRSQRLDRAAGDAPNIGRVGRMPGTGLPKGVKRKRRRSDRGRGDRTRNNRKKVLATWSALAVVISIAGLIVVSWMWLRSRQTDRQATGDGLQPDLQRRVVSEFESPTENEALGIVKQALEVTAPGAVEELFRLGASTPEDVVDFLRNMKKTDGDIEELVWLRSMDTSDLLLEGVLVKTMFQSRPKSRLAMLTPDESGVWKVDFEAFARVIRPSWDGILKQVGQEGEVRVILGPDTYYNGIFRDESQWACFGMASPDLDSVLVGYCRKGSAQEVAMNRIIKSETDQEAKRELNRATLRVRRVEGAEERQLEITRVLAEDWVKAETDFDGHFE